MVCNGVLETVGRMTYQGKFGDFPFTAHPKRDPVTEELHFFGYRIDKKPAVRYGVLDKQGKLTKEICVDTPLNVMLHDFAITENYVIFPVFPLIFSPKVKFDQHPANFVYHSLWLFGIAAIANIVEEQLKILILWVFQKNRIVQIY